MDLSRLAFVCYSGKREGTVFPVEHWPVSIGRHPRNAIVLDDEPSVSGYHCRIVQENDRLCVYDLKSRCGTYLNGCRVDYRAELVPNVSVLGVGQVKLGLVEESRQETPENVMSQLFHQDSILIPSTKHIQKADEVVLVVDVAGSTDFGEKFGDTALVKHFGLLGRVFERSAQRRGVLFMKCTGDGFLATFENVRQALTVACQVLGFFALAAPKSRSLNLRCALHRGPVRVNAKGDRFGLTVHLCVRLEGLKEQELAAEPDSPELPPVNRILVTDEICEEMPPKWRARTSFLGTFIPKGFSRPVRVHTLHWKDLVSRTGAKADDGERTTSSRHLT
jgi:class 3 adenylate cyclase